jgi:pimeloyl-ACP methyl ester carboxylesterase/DNA-binding CsgD family transcriptional regulator
MTPHDSHLSDENIVKLAYAMAIGPQRYVELFSAIESRLQPVLDDVDSDDTQVSQQVSEGFSPIEAHMDNALLLMQSRGRQRDTAPGSTRVIEADTKPSFLINSSGTILFSNQAARDTLGLTREMKLLPEHLSHGDYEKLLTHLRDINHYDQGPAIDVFDFYAKTSEQNLQMVLTHVSGATGESLALITAVHMSWYPKIATRFKDLFKLTDVELEITKAVVTGQSLADLASDRKRSLGTVRQQTKKLLGKLNLHSQIELVTLYSGFSKFSLSNLMESQESNESDRQSSQHVLTRPHERIIDFECAGPVSGKPVLFLPALLGGNTITPDINASLETLNIRLIMPWRPGLSQSQENGPPDFASFERYADDLSALFDQLKLKSCVVIGHITSTIFALAFAKYHPSRVKKLVIVNGIIPTAKGAHAKQLEKAERMRLMLIRHAPRVGKFIVHSMLAKVDAGFDEEFLSIFLDNEIDLKTVKSPAIRSEFRKAFSRTTLQGYNSFTNELIQSTLDWSPLFDDLGPQIEWLVGSNNPIYTADYVSLFLRNYNKITVREIENTAHLLFYQAPDIVLRHAQSA